MLLMDGLDQSRTRAERALTASGLFLRGMVAMHPSPDRKPTYRIFVASREPGSVTEESFCMRLVGAAHFTPEYEAMRRDMDCAPHIPFKRSTQNRKI